MNRYQTTFNTWNKIADLYQEKFMDLDIYDDSYDLFCQYIQQPNARILEIGCGPGNITKYLLNKRPDFKIEAIDVAPNMIKLAKENNPTANFKVMDCRKIDTLSDKFDAVMCGFCMPYLSKEDCFKLIKDGATLLHTDGILYVSTIEGDYQNSGFETGSTGDAAYVYYHDSRYLERSFYEHNFEILQCIKKEYSKNDGSIQTHLIFIAKKKEDLIL